MAVGFRQAASYMKSRSASHRSCRRCSPPPSRRVRCLCSVG